MRKGLTMTRTFGRLAGTAAFCGLIAVALSGCIDSLGSRSDAPAAGTIALASSTPGGGSEDFVLNVGRRTYFREGSAELDGVAKDTLDKQAAWLKRYPVWSVKIQGFADDPGSAGENTSLSSRRAQAVRAYLAEQGVAASRVAAKGYGRDRLVRTCDDLSCKSQNRRVVTNLVGDRDL